MKRRYNCNDRPKNVCMSKVNKLIDVCTPITLETVVDVEDVTIECCDADIVCERQHECGGRQVFEFSVRQRICVEIPLEYTTEVKIL